MNVRLHLARHQSTRTGLFLAALGFVFLLLPSTNAFAQVDPSDFIFTLVKTPDNTAIRDLNDGDVINLYDLAKSDQISELNLTIRLTGKASDPDFVDFRLIKNANTEFKRPEYPPFLTLHGDRDQGDNSDDFEAIDPECDRGRIPALVPAEYQLRALDKSGDLIKAVNFTVTRVGFSHTLVPNAPLTVQFEGGRADLDSCTDFTSTPISSWSWNFGDTINNIANEQNPVHEYSRSDTFQVNMTANYSGGGSETVTKSVVVADAELTDAEFVCEATGLTVTCTDNSTPADRLINWQWDFGDNTDTTYTERAPTVSHRYDAEGNYTVKLTVTDTQNQSISDSTEISVEPRPIFADFSQSTDSLKATFYDRSVSPDGKIDSWLWNFGDPNSSANEVSGQDTTVHTFSRSDSFLVTLTVSDNFDQEARYRVSGFTSKPITPVPSPPSIPWSIT